MYSDITEQSGTFHTDASNISGSNVLGGPIVTGADTHYAHRVFNIYKRIVDRSSSTYDSRVYTNMKAALQKDGTYTIDLETYAISPNHYQYVGDRPTDYIIVMDKSQSAAIAPVLDCNGNPTGETKQSIDGTALRAWSSTNSLAVKSLCRENDTKLPPSGTTGVNGYSFSNPDEQVYFKHTDGKYYRIYLAINTMEMKDPAIGESYPTKQYYWAYYIDGDGKYNVLKSNNENGVGTPNEVLTRDEFYYNVDNGLNRSGVSSATTNGSRRDAVIYIGEHYTYTCGVHDANITTRIETIKAKAVELVGEIAEQGSDNRIAITYYDDSSHYLSPNGWASSGFTDAFWDADSNAENLKTQIGNISNTSNNPQTDNSGMEFAIANNIMNNSNVDYSANGDRNCVIIFMSDGVPGADGQSDITTAANNVINKSLEAKNKGAFVYTVLVGEDGADFDKTAYMDEVSSKYPAATAMNILGGANVDGVEYTANLGDITYERFSEFASILGKELVKNKL